MNDSVRCIWIIKLPSPGTKKSALVVFSRRFPTVEKRAKLILGKAYTPVPLQSVLLPLLVQQTASGYASQFISSRDRCSSVSQKPVHRIQTDDGMLWPIVAVEKHGLLLCCLPLAEICADIDDMTKPVSVNLPSIALGFELLGALAEFLIVPSIDFQSRLNELPEFINEAAPFGSIRDGSAENICARLANRPCTLSKKVKVPAWRSASYRGKATLQLAVVEHVNASQCAQETWQDTSQVYGSVMCRAEFEGPQCDISLNLTAAADGFGVPLDMLLVHPCVQRADWQDLEEADSDPRAGVRRLRFSPPLENFTLCHYTVKRLQELPIFGVYEMKPEETKATISVQLKLNDQIKNNFEVCSLRIPFYTRAPITGLDGAPSQGSMHISNNKREIVWNIGQKFASKDQQALLAATVTFSSSEQNLPAPTLEDAFCKGNNSYAQLSFKILDFTHSGCSVDPKSIQVSPSSKFKLSHSREYSSVDYKIWNSSGEGLVCPKE